ncbi:MAG: thiamine-monophosphate kinase [Candidatus Omnitrophica bacterium]|nr:thiamine-monophosphate kinase [Candidatus Omnitrophota bacterium]
MDESAFLGWVRRRTDRGPGVRVGIGDDAAVLAPLKPGAGWTLKADMIVEGTHFDRTPAPALWGRKAVMVNASDLAATGAKPRYVLLSVGLPAGSPATLARAIYSGAHRAAREVGAYIVGGDTCRSRDVVVSVMMAGELAGRHPLRRAGMRAGHEIWVSGALGDSLASGHHLSFRPRLREAFFWSRITRWAV